MHKVASLTRRLDAAERLLFVSCRPVRRGKRVVSRQNADSGEPGAKGGRLRRRDQQNCDVVQTGNIDPMRSFRISPDARYRSAAGAGIIGVLDFTTVAKIGFTDLQRFDCGATAARRLKLCPAGAVVGCEGQLEKGARARAGARRYGGHACACLPPSQGRRSIERRILVSPLRRRTVNLNA